MDEATLRVPSHVAHLVQEALARLRALAASEVVVAVSKVALVDEVVDVAASVVIEAALAAAAVEVDSVEAAEAVEAMAEVEVA